MDSSSFERAKMSQHFANRGLSGEIAYYPKSATFEVGGTECIAQEKFHIPPWRMCFVCTPQSMMMLP